MALYSMGCLVSAQFLFRGAKGLGWAFGGVSLFGLLYSLVPWTNAQLVFVCMASLPFVGLALAWPAMQAWVGDEPDPAARARYLSGFNIATAFGFTVSPLVAGPLFDLDQRLPFLALLLLCALVVGLLASLPHGAARHGKPAEVEDAAPQAEGTVSNGMLYASWCATFAANGLNTAARSIYPKQIEIFAASKELTLIGSYRPGWFDAVGAATTFSWLAFLLSLGTVVCFMVLGRTSFWKHRFGIICGGQALAGAAFMVLGHAQSFAVLMVCFVILGVNYGLCFFSSLFYSLEVAGLKHRRAAINEGALGAGGFVGGVGVGYLAERIGLTGAFFWSPLAVAAAIALQLLLLKRRGNHG